jgi:hypothetical protein
MRVQIKVLNKLEGVERVFLSEIEDASTTKEVLDEFFRGRQAVGNGHQTMIRLGTDKNFFGVSTKSEITDWITRRLKEDRNEKQINRPTESSF